MPASMVKMKYYLVDPTSPGPRTVLLVIRKIVRLCVCLVDCLVWNHRRHLDGLNVKIQRLEVVHIWPFLFVRGDTCLCPGIVPVCYSAHNTVETTWALPPL